MHAIPKKLFLLSIRLYQKTLSPDHGLMRFLRRGQTCRFYPTCSEYAYAAFDKYGVWKGMRLTLSRLRRCNPWNPGGLDPVP